MGIKPAYLISGGPSMDRSLMVEDLRTAMKECGISQPRVAYVGSASGDSRLFYLFMRRLLKKAGAAHVEMVPLMKRSANAQRARHVLQKADVIFISGGEPEDGMIGLEKFGLSSFLAELREQGKLFIGISAGAIMMGMHWVHWDVKGDDSTAHLIDCLGFFPQTFDAHGEKEDWKDLRCAVSLMGPDAKGYGLVSDGFYRIDEKGTITSFRNEPVLLQIDGNRIRDISDELT